jgi:hypothetical protein
MRLFYTARRHSEKRIYFIMKRFTLWLMSGITALTLVSCGDSTSQAPKAEAPTTTMAKPAEKAAAKPAAKSAAPAAGFAALQTVVSTTKAAIVKGDFNQAKTEFGKFETAWKPVEDGIKAKAPKLYTAIENGMDSIEQGIKSKDKAKTLSALDALKASITSAAL